MKILQYQDRWRVVHGGRVVTQSFDSETEAEGWADHNVDDQVFDTPNNFSEPLEYDRDLFYLQGSVVCTRETPVVVPTAGGKHILVYRGARIGPDFDSEDAALGWISRQAAAWS